MAEKIFKESLAFHKKHRGKIEVRSKVPVRTSRDLSLAYTPGVAEACREIAKNPERIFDYTFRGNTVAVVSDGSSILGLGNLGAKAALPVMEGKALLFKEFGGVDAFPICLDTQDTEEIIKAVKLIAPVFGGINLEDIAAPRCFEIERRLRAELEIPVMHDDQHGTATVVLAAMINALKLRNLSPEKARVVLNGAGAAGSAVARLLLAYGFKNVTLADSRGAVYEGRDNMDPEKASLARLTNHERREGNLSTLLRGADIFIGVSRANLVTEEMVREMNKQPIVCALANPPPEIMPDLARRGGAFVVATGRSDFPNQINNLLAFPGIFRGALDRRIKQFEDKMFIRAAEAIARYVKRPTPEMIVPSALDRGVAKVVARAIW